MLSFKSLALVSLVLGLGAFGAGCAAQADEPTEVAAAEAVSASKVKLPAGDACRDVLAPLALGLADGAAGLAYTKAVTVSLVSETDTRVYVVDIARTFGGAVRYEVELDNDSHSMCLLEAIKVDPKAALGKDKRAAATAKETQATAPITVSPAGDDCASTVKLLAQAAGVSSVGASQLVRIDAKLVSATDEREYAVHVDGKAFVANGKTFPNDMDFTLVLDNDSASKCFVQSIELR